LLQIDEVEVSDLNSGFNYRLHLDNHKTRAGLPVVIPFQSYRRHVGLTSLSGEELKTMLRNVQDSLR
jgi:hypothetical protein